MAPKDHFRCQHNSIKEKEIYNEILSCYITLSRTHSTTPYNVDNTLLYSPPPMKRNEIFERPHVCHEFITNTKVVMRNKWYMFPVNLNSFHNNTFHYVVYFVSFYLILSCKVSSILLANNSFEEQI